MDEAVLRTLDANLNRAREALRVVEDFARFILDDRGASGALKELRHRLRGIADALGVHALRESRAIASDVGRATKTATELTRATAEDVAAAAFARAAEALRTIEEFAKLCHADAARDAEAIRYAVYELELRLLVRGDRRRRFRDTRLYVIVTEALCKGDWLETANAALRGGASCLQLREKGLSDRALLDRARELRRLTADHGALLIVNDRPDIARIADADGVHVGQDDLRIEDARRIAGSRLLIGVSSHNLAQARAARDEGADYIAVGPMFATATKPHEPAAGVELLSQASRDLATPLVAIGGITTTNARDLTARGATCLCVCSAVIASDNPTAAAAAILAAATTK